MKIKSLLLLVVILTSLGGSEVKISDSTRFELKGPDATVNISSVSVSSLQVKENKLVLGDGNFSVSTNETGNIHIDLNEWSPKADEGETVTQFIANSSARTVTFSIEGVREAKYRVERDGETIKETDISDKVISFENSEWSARKFTLTAVSINEDTDDDQGDGGGGGGGGGGSGFFGSTESEEENQTENQTEDKKDDQVNESEPEVSNTTQQENKTENLEGDENDTEQKDRQNRPEEDDRNVFERAVVPIILIILLIVAVVISERKLRIREKIFNDSEDDEEIKEKIDELRQRAQEAVSEEEETRKKYKDGRISKEEFKRKMRNIREEKESISQKIDELEADL